MLDRECIRPLLSRPRKALKIKGFFGPKALHISPMTTYPVTGLSPPLLFGTVRAVFRSIGFWQIVAAAEDAFLSVCPVEQGGAQASVQRQDGGAKPTAYQRICDALRTDTFLAVIKEQTIPAIIVAAAMYQPPGGAVLLIVHVNDHGASSPAGNLM